MNHNFPHIITLLRKEKNLTQKQAAAELGISQALLSHYEKGIRECSLDFVVKVSDYYDVSCDYLLGKTSERTLDISETSGQSSHSHSTYSEINRKLLTASAGVVYDKLGMINNRRLTRASTLYLMTGIYKLLRQLYSANPENSRDVFSISDELYKGYGSSMQEKLFADIISMSTKTSKDYVNTLDDLYIAPGELANQYQDGAAAIFNVIQQVEGQLNRIKK